jgi:catechol 2,3-dioxygenase-like lactoylglutathione lyase family enzyme
MTPAGGGALSLKVVLRCRDFPASRRFYADVLGLPVVEEWDAPEGRGCVFGCGPTGREGFLEIYGMTREDPRYDPAFHAPVPTDKIDVQLGADSVDAWALRLEGRWPFEGPTALPWGQRWIRLRDPDGLLVALYEGLDPGRRR